MLTPVEIASLFFLLAIFSAIVGVFLFNYGEHVSIKSPKKIALIIIILSVSMIYFIGSKVLPEKRRGEFYESNFQGIVLDKYFNKKNHYSPVLIYEQGKFKKKFLKCPNDFYNQIEIGDSIFKRNQSNYLILVKQDEADSVYIEVN